MAENLALVENRTPTLGRMILDRVAKSSTGEAFRIPVGEGWKSLTWKQVGDQCNRIAAGLVAIGIEPEDRVAIASNTRYDWIAADFAIMLAGAATTTVYPSTMAEDVSFILANSGSRVVFAEDDAQIAKLHERKAEIGDIFKVITFDGTADGDWVISLADLEKLGEQYLADNPNVIEERVAGSKPDSLATLVYTSGTTGKPKGVRLLQSAWTYEGAAIDAMNVLSANDLQYLWLPLSHVFGKVLTSTQLQIGFPTAVDGRVDKIVENLAVVKPTFVAAVPRIFEKAHGRVVNMAKSEGGAKAKIFDWAFAVGKQVTEAQLAGKRVRPMLAAQHRIADKLVFTKIRARFGGNLRFFISGAAALNGDLARWFHAAGILILEGWGMTETAAGASLNRPDKFRFGTIGLPFPGCTITIAPDGEILVKGPNVMEGYHANPEATAETIDAEGWLHTGDIGEIDAEGFVKITDRKKDLFKTSGGKYVAPSAIEGAFKALCPYVSQFVVFGNERNFCSAIVTLDPDAIVGWAKENGVSGSYAEIAGSDAAKAMVQGYVDELNSKLNKWESIKKFIILDHDMSVEGGEITPSLKVKRKVVEENNKSALDALYS